MATSTVLYVDASDVMNTLTILRNDLKIDQVGQKIRNAAIKTGRKVPEFMVNDIPDDYNADDASITKSVGRLYTRGSGGTASCIVPIRGKKLTIGGKTVNANGGVPGWASMLYKGNPYTITASILSGETSTLPGYMSKFGGNAPFRNTSARKLHGAVFVRKSEERNSIVSMSALAVPQMVMNRSADEILDDVSTDFLNNLMIEL